MIKPIVKIVTINASTFTVWEALTNPDIMKQWMGEPEMALEVTTDWRIGSPIAIKGFHHVNFVNKGTVLRFEPGKVLEYNYLSSLSRLPEHVDNYTIIHFELESVEDGARLSLTVSNFPTEVIFKHVDFYWTTTLEILKKLLEKH